MFGRRRQDPDAIDLADRCVNNAAQAIEVGREMAEFIQRLSAECNRLNAELSAAQAELVLLDKVCGHYVLDETRFLQSDGEPFGSVPIEAGTKAREAGRRYAGREKAELDARQAAAEAVLDDPKASGDDAHDARSEIEFIGYARARLAPLLSSQSGEG